MKFRSLRLHNFGNFAKREFDFSLAPFVLLYGPNESGKSTLLQGLRESLFGFSSSSYSLGGEMSAEIDAVMRDGGELRYRRRRGRKNVVEGTLGLHSSDGKSGSEAKAVDEDSVRQLLGGLDAATYANLFGFSLKELALGEASLKGSSLTEALLGNAQANAVDWKGVRKRLQTERDALLTARGRNQRIPELLRMLRENQRNAEQWTIKPKVYRELQWQSEKLEGEQESIRQRREERAQELRTLHRHIEAWSIAFRLDGIRKKLELNPLPPKLTLDWANNWRTCQDNLRTARDEQQGIEQELELLARQRAAVPNTPFLLDRLESLRHLASSIPTQQDQLQRLDQLQSRIELLSQQSESIRSGLQLSIDPNAIDAPALGITAKQALRDILTPLQSEWREYERLEGEQNKSQQTLGLYRTRIENASSANSTSSNDFSYERLVETFLEYQSALQEWNSLESLRQECERLQRAVRKRCQSEAPLVWDSLPTEMDIESSTRDLDRWSQSRHDLIRERHQLDRELLNATHALQELDSQGTLPSLKEMEELRKQRDHWTEALRDADLAEEESLPLFTSMRIDKGETLEESSFRAESLGETIASDRSTDEPLSERDSSMRPSDSPSTSTVRLRGTNKGSGTSRASKSNKRQTIYLKLKNTHASLDAMVSRMLNEAQRFAKRDQVQRTIDELNRRKTLVDNQIQEIETQRSQADLQWKERWKSLGVVAESMEVVKQWVNDVRTWRTQTAQVALVQQRFEHALEKLDARCLEAEQSMGLSSVTDCSDPQPIRDLAYFQSRMQKVRDQSELVQKERSQVASWQELLKRESESLESTQRQLRECLLRRDEWEGKFQSWLAQFGFPESSSPTAAEALMEQLAELRKIESEIVSANSERQMLKQRVEEFSSAVDHALSRNPSDANSRDMQRLFQELLDGKSQAENAANHQQQLQMLTVRFEEKEIALRAKQQQAEKWETERQSMMSEVQESDPARVDDWAKQAKEYWDQQVTMIRLQDQIQMIYQVETIDPILDELLASDSDRLSLEAQRAQDDMKLMDQEIQAISMQLGAIGQQLKDLEGEDQAMLLSQERENLCAQLDRTAEQWMILSIADTLLENAVDAFRKQQQSGVLGDVVRIFSNLTNHAYIDVRSDPMDPTKFVAVDASGDEKRPEQMSTGTREQLYLAIRLAYVEHYCREHEPLPLVMDDCFVNFDEPRLDATIKALRDQQSVEQTILLSCHERTVETVRRAIPDAVILSLG